MSQGHVAMAGICLTAVVLPVFADSPAAEPTAPLPLDTVTVTVNRLPEPLSKVAPNVGVIRREDMDRQGADDLATLFASEPGVSVPGETQRRGASGVTIRGISGNRVLMTVDGERLPDGYASTGRGYIAGRDWIEPDTLRQIEVIKGPASSLFGSDAIGGVVRFRTHDPDDFVDADTPLYFGLKQSYDGANQGWGTTATFAAAGDEVSTLLMATRRRAHETDNQGTVGGTGSLRTRSDPQTTDTQNVLAKVELGLTGPHRFIVSAEQFDRKRATELLADSGWTSSVGSDDSHDDAVRNRVGVEYRFTGSGGTLAGARFKLYQQTLNARDRATRVATSGSSDEDNAFDQSVQGLDGQLNWVLGRHSVVAGMELSHTRTSRLTRTTSTTATTSSTSESRYFPDSRSDRIGLFVQDGIALGTARLTPSLRYDHYRLSPQVDSVFAASSGSPSLSTFNDGAWSPRLGLMLPIGGGVTGFANLSTGFRAPPFDSAFMDRSVSYGGYGYKILQNPDLKSETSRGVELGARYAGTGVEAQLTTFYNRYHDFIDVQQVGVSGGYLIYQYQNRGQVAIHGVEGRAAWDVMANVRLSSTMAWAHGQDLSDGKPLNSVDPLKATLGAEYRRDGWGGNVLWTMVARKTRIDTGTASFQTPGYGVLDLGGWYAFGRHATLRVGLNNVLDKKYWKWAVINETYNTGAAPDLYSEAGRNVTASIDIRF